VEIGLGNLVAAELQLEGVDLGLQQRNLMAVRVVGSGKLVDGMFCFKQESLRFLLV
jgi:hypothetical protein